MLRIFFNTAFWIDFEKVNGFDDINIIPYQYDSYEIVTIL